MKLKFSFLIVLLITFIFAGLKADAGKDLLDLLIKNESTYSNRNLKKVPIIVEDLIIKAKNQNCLNNLYSYEHGLMTSYALAISRGFAPCIVECLSRNGAQQNIKIKYRDGYEYNSILELIVRNKLVSEASLTPEIMEWLLDQDDVKAPIIDGALQLHLALKYKCSEEFIDALVDLMNSAGILDSIWTNNDFDHNLTPLATAYAYQAKKDQDYVGKIFTLLLRRGAKQEIPIKWNGKSHANIKHFIQYGPIDTSGSRKDLYDILETIPTKSSSHTTSSSGSSSSSSHVPSSSSSKVKKNNPPQKVKKIKDPLTKNLSTLKKKLRTLKEKLKKLAKNLATLKSNLK